MDKVTFSEETIQKLFGHEAAENEAPERLREYYFKSSIYDQVATDLSLRLLVGHKGIGKSALFKIAMSEDPQQGRLPILIRPDDILGLKTDSTDFLQTIRDWTDGLIRIIARKVLLAAGMPTDTATDKLVTYGGRLVGFLADTFEHSKPVNLDPSKDLVIASFLKNRKIHVYVDDLDRGWEGRRVDVMRVSALLNAIRDISTDNPGVRFRVALRSDVYYLVRTSDESTDKIEGSVVWHTWTNHEILVLLVKRIETFFGRAVDENELLRLSQAGMAWRLDPVFEATFTGRGHWDNAPMYRVLMSLIRKRPRDLVKLCTLAAKNAARHKAARINTAHLSDVFEEYSAGRVTDTVNEFRSELPDIERLLTNMKPNKRERTAREGYVYATDALLKKIKHIMETGNFTFTNGKPASAKELAAFMYKINFITARKGGQGGMITRKYFEENRYLSSQFADFGFDWEVHPAYRWALQPDTIADVYQSLQLSDER